MFARPDAPDETGDMTLVLGIVIGIILIVVLRIALMQLMLVKLRRDVAALNAGDHKPLLSGYAKDAVIVFNDGDHRWAGDHVGHAAIDTFLANFVHYGIKGEITDLWIGGWPWSMTILVGFDDHADGPDGTRVYQNHTVLMCRTRMGKIVHQEDFYVDTVRMLAFDKKLTELGINPL
jgi:ketosteroid isomerase-like protein